MIIVTGNTFGHRDLLKAMGGRWNNADRNWQFSYLSDDQIEQLRAMVGVFVVTSKLPSWMTEEDDTPEAPRPPTQQFGDDQSFFNYFEDQNPTAFFGFSSLHAFADFVEALPRPGINDIGWKTDEKYVAFSGTDDMAQALDLARNGWTDGLGITGMLVVDAPQAKRRYHCVAGSTVNVGRMLAGDPRHMIRRTRQPGQRSIRIFVETIMWRGIGTGIATFRALLIAAMIDLLEREGYRCEVIGVATTLYEWTANPLAQLAVRIKEAGERLNLLDMSFALGHPSFSRRLFFAAMGSVPACRTTDDNRGFISTAFSDDHPCAKNEFYIPQIFGLDAIKLGDDPMALLPFIEPENLPIKLKRKD